ncbi:hypothetical protein ACFFP0_15590 [Rhizobium puerariae]|uniref:O-antigen ligase domain-containing protein n=1 Tax=Rhizobium puerariae TaxID=1585791 RepID=A0ABV6AI46_9HYPH
MGISAVEKFLLSVMALAVLCLRPSVIGEVYSIFSLALLLGAATALFGVSLSTGRVLVPERFAVINITLIYLISLYVLTRTILFMPAIDATDETKAFMIISGFLLAVLLVISNRAYATTFFDALAILVIASSISLTITMVLLLAGIPAYQLTIGKIAYTYANRGDFAFPFTFLYNEVSTPFGVIPRLSGVFREPGIFPLYGCWAAAYAYRRGWPTPIWLVCLFATAACLSSIGAPLALYTGAMIVMIRAGIKPLPALLLLLVVGLLTWQILYTSEYLDLQSKVNSGSGSFEERMYLAEAAFDASNVIFGDGYGFSIFTTGPISLVAAIRVFGLVFFVGFLICYALAAVDLKLWMTGLVPPILGVVFTQPVFREPGFMIMLFSGIVFIASKPSFSALPSRRDPVARTGAFRLKNPLLENPLGR